MRGHCTIALWNAKTWQYLISARALLRDPT